MASSPQMQRSFQDVLQDIIGNVQQIIKYEFQLAKTEVKERVTRAAGPTSDQIVKRILETRTDLSDNINELEDKVKTAMDWRTQFEKHPGTVLGVAFAGGALLSALLPSMRGSHDGPARGDWTESNTRAAQVRETVPNKRTSDTLGTVKIALIGLAASRLTNYINELLPGFEHEFSKARSGRSNPDWAR